MAYMAYDAARTGPRRIASLVVVCTILGMTIYKMETINHKMPTFAWVTSKLVAT